MEIDWITLGAQVVNFVILVLLLRHFLYGRILGAVERREEEIQDRLDQAREKEEEAREEAEAHRREREELQEKRDELLREAREAAEEEREKRLEEVRREADAARERWRDQLEREREDFLRELRERAAQATWKMVERALGDLADEDLQRRTVDTFVKRVEEAGGDSELAEAVSGADDLVLRSAFELADEDRERIRELLQEELGAGDGLDFQVDPELILGLRLEAGDQEVQWSVRDQMRALEERVREILAREVREEEEPEEDEEAGEEEKEPEPDAEDEETEEEGPEEEES